jgi:DNA-binding NarL/FixJ family response regulator
VTPTTRDSAPAAATRRPVRVVVGESEVLIREGIRRLFETVDGLEVVDAVSDLASLWAAVETRRPDVVVTNAGLPPTRTDEGIRFAVELRQSHPEIAVVVLSEQAEGDAAVNLFAGGVLGRGYLLKERVVDGTAFAETVRTVAGGGSHVDERIVESLLRPRDGRRSPAFAKLTPRDCEILRLMAQGMSNTAIARELGVTSRAVERHVGSIFSKLGIEDSPDNSRRVLAVLAYLDDGSAARRVPAG